MVRRIILPVFAKLPYAEVLSLLPQAVKDHLGFQSHQEGAAVGDLQVEPQT